MTRSSIEAGCNCFKLVMTVAWSFIGLFIIREPRDDVGMATRRKLVAQDTAVITNSFARNRVRIEALKPRGLVKSTL